MNNSEALTTLIVGGRTAKEYSQRELARRVGINIISFFIKLKAHKKICDTTSGFRAISKKIIKEFANDYPYEYPEPISTVTILKKGYKIKEVPVSMNERTYGKSSIKTWKKAYYMFNVIISILFTGFGGRKWV